ncbi:MAG: class F sortase [Patescibacteria group bacterium]|nr:class F sortase [Patescibacteria group bacterium]
MQKKRVLRSLLIIAVGATAFCLVYAASLIRPPNPEIIVSVGANIGLPARLRIPALNIDATVEQVGLTPLGAMDVPKGPSDVAWYELGPRPGEDGSAVIAGHEGWKDSIPAVFDNLFKISAGDKIYVTDENGATSVFIVKKTRIFDEDQEVPSVFNSNDGKAHLNLITCAGVWNAVTKSFSKRLVVFADKE